MTVGTAGAKPPVPFSLLGSTMSKRLPLARSTAETERAEAARPGLHRTHIALLAQSRHRVVRETIARRDDVPLGIQAALANDDWWEVRAAMAANPRAAWSVMDGLASDRHHQVLLALITNPHLEASIGARLAQHRRQDVRDAMAHRLRTSPLVEIVHDPGEDHLIPELRERATAWVDGEAVSNHAPNEPEPVDMIDAEEAATLGAAARAATPLAHGAAVPAPEADVQPQPIAAAAVFEPGPSDPLDEPDRAVAATAHPGHDFLVVTLPDDLGPSHAGAAHRPGAAAPLTLATRVAAPAASGRTYTRTH